jgi:flavin reductase (DIM6/NTAB) family NADH-FMN oxidoreductase RutF
MPLKNAAGLFERIEREIWIVTAAQGGRRGGLVATFVSSASIVVEMPRIIVGISKRHETRTLIEGSNAFAVHLVDESQLELVWRFGLQSSRDTDKFAGLETRVSRTGSPILSAALAWLDCRVEESLDIGDRTLYLAEVIEGESRAETRPLTTHRMIELASADKLATLRDQMADDAVADAETIRRWRGRE